MAVSRGDESSTAPGVTRFTVASSGAAAPGFVGVVPFSFTFMVPLNLFNTFPNLIVACPQQLASQELQAIAQASHSNTTGVEGLCCGARRSLVERGGALSMQAGGGEAAAAAAMVCQPVSGFWHMVGVFSGQPDGWACGRSGGAWVAEQCGCPEAQSADGRMCCRAAGAEPRGLQRGVLSGWVRRLLRGQ